MSDALWPGLRRIVANQTGEPAEILTPAVELIGDVLHLDSLEVIEVAMACEDAFHVEFTAAELAAFTPETTLADLLALLAGKGARPPAAGA